MLRVGLTGGLGSGKSTAAALFAGHGARILSSDEIARELMQPGEAVYSAIVERFGPGVVRADGLLDRGALASIAFSPDSQGKGRVEELNAIIHPATIARQAERAEEIAARDARAVVMVESALIFETKYGGESGWRSRFDRLILVTAPEELKIARFIARSTVTGLVTEERRSALEAEACRRLALQLPDEQKAGLCDYIVTNSGPMAELQWQVDQLWPLLLAVEDGQDKCGGLSTAPR